MSISRELCWLMRGTSVAGLAFGLAAGLLGSALTAPLGQGRAAAAVVNTQTAVSWGFDGLGELGDGTTNNRSLFGTVDAGSGIVQVAAGLDHGLAVTSSGTVEAWGSNGDGQLGDGTTTMQTVPVHVKGLTGVVAVAAGYFHSMALRSDGTVWAWGDNTDGELGTGTTARSLVPVRVKGLTGITEISAGRDFSLARRSDGTVWAWGINSGSQLGNGTTTNSLVPVQVSGLTQVTSIAAGGFAGYAIRTTSTGATSAWAWGSNGDGELGDGTTTDHHSPEQVTGIAAPGIASIAAGWVYALALGTDGSVWGWGNDANGELGNAPTSTVALRPVQTRLPGSGIVQLAASSELTAELFTGRVFLHTLALRSDGTVWAWGRQHRGSARRRQHRRPDRAGRGRRPGWRHPGCGRQRIQPGSHDVRPRAGCRRRHDDRCEQRAPSRGLLSRPGDECPRLHVQLHRRDQVADADRRNLGEVQLAGLGLRRHKAAAAMQLTGIAARPGQDHSGSATVPRGPRTTWLPRPLAGRRTSRTCLPSPPAGAAASLATSIGSGWGTRRPHNDHSVLTTAVDPPAEKTRQNEP
ncbi:MAG TPA: hypothetical protein VHJ18_19900 [Streptosporangiaceae bacterium]|nr:hypothetical protein [Streptosporangiaceae bacterium]